MVLCAAWGCSGCWKLWIHPGCSLLSLSAASRGFPASSHADPGVWGEEVAFPLLGVMFWLPGTYFCIQTLPAWGCLGQKGNYMSSQDYILAAWDMFLHPDFASLGVFRSKRQLYLPSGLCFGCLGRISASRLCRLGRVWVKKATVRPLRVMFCLLLESAGSRRGEMLSWPGGTGAVTLVCDGL